MSAPGTHRLARESIGYRQTDNRTDERELGWEMGGIGRFSRRKEQSWVNTADWTLQGGISDSHSDSKVWVAFGYKSQGKHSKNVLKLQEEIWLFGELGMTTSRSIVLWEERGISETWDQERRTWRTCIIGLLHFTLICKRQWEPRHSSFPVTLKYAP